MQILTLSPDELDKVIEKKVTCPFLGAAVHEGALNIRNTADRPLASVDEIHELGDSGGGSLGLLLAFFARGNHGRIPDAGGAFRMQAPDGFFSLDLPGSQGAHHGHSGVLMGDPLRIDQGRLDPQAFERLKALAPNGRLTHAVVGKFVAANIKSDPKSRRVSLRSLLGGIRGIGAGVVDDIGDFLGFRDDEEDPQTIEELAEAMGDDNLLGSSGEFALLFALLENKPGDEEEGISMSDVEGMFLRRIFPAGWETWPKSLHTWLRATLAIALAARSEIRKSHVA